MRLGRLRAPEWLAGIGGAALIVLLFAPFYEPARAGSGDSSSAWEALSVVPVVVAITGALGISILITAAAYRTAAITTALAGVTTLIALLATILLATRTLWPPELDGGEATREPALYLALVVTALLALAGWRSMANEHASSAAYAEAAADGSGQARLLSLSGASGEPSGSERA